VEKRGRQQEFSNRNRREDRTNHQHGLQEKIHTKHTFVISASNASPATPELLRVFVTG
jgi:hypothetical protein